jgi:two-component system chemotaxis response regulator CheB
MRAERLLNATCPECRGPLSEVIEDGVREYRCLVEHRYSVTALLHAHSETQERTLWTAALVLEEAALIAREAAKQLPESAATLEVQAQEKLRQSAAIKEVLSQLRAFVLE